MSSQAGRPTVSVEIDRGVVDTATPDNTTDKKVKAATPKPDKMAERQAQLESKLASGSYIPELGFPAFLYGLNKLFRHPEKLPRPTKKENVRRANEAVEHAILARSQYVHERIKDATNFWTAPINGEVKEWDALGTVIVTANQKGGSGKSTVGTLLGDYFADEHDLLTIILPIAANDGSTALKAGAEDAHTANLVQLEALLKELTQNGTVKADAKKVTAKLRKNDKGAYVVAQAALPSNFGGMRLRWVLNQLKQMFQVIILDTGNELARFGGRKQGLPSGGNVSFEAGMQADVLIFTCNPEVSDSPILMGKTMDSYAAIGNKRKLENAIVVVTGHKDGEHDVADWVKFAESKVDMLGRPIGPRDFPFRVAKRVAGESPKGALVLMPYEESLKRSPRPVLADMQPATQRVIEELAYQVVVRTCINQDRDLADLDAIKQAHRDELDYSPYDGLSPEEIAANLAASDIVSGGSILTVDHNGSKR